MQVTKVILKTIKVPCKGKCKKERPHHAKGYCKTCYIRVMRQRRKKTEKK